MHLDLYLNEITLFMMCLSLYLIGNQHVGVILTVPLCASPFANSTFFGEPCKLWGIYSGYSDCQVVPRDWQKLS